MTLIAEEEYPLLQIDHFIFHVVHHDAAEPVLLEETEIGEFHDFFLGRIKDTLKGNRFIFLPTSPTLSNLRALAEEPERFVEITQAMAQSFHARRDKRIKPGVFIVMRLHAGNRTFFSLIKYDHERVVTYELQDRRAVLRSIASSFTQSPDALHKSALIELTADNAEIVVIDRTVRSEITEFFRGFLDVKRKFTNAQLTAVVENVLVQTVREHQQDLPAEMVARARERFAEVVEQRDEFEAEPFVAEYFGPHGSEVIKEKFERLLTKKHIAGEVFRFEGDAVQVGRTIKYQTAEGITIDVPEYAKETMDITHDPDGNTTTITIETSRLSQK